MIYKVLILTVIVVFYSFYLLKLFNLNSKGIKTNQAGNGNKNKKIIITERIMSISNGIQIAVMLLSIFQIKTHNNKIVNILCILVGIIGVIFFAKSTITMKNNWRIGIPEEKTQLVTNGIYKWSRNPAFVGFDLMYVAVLIMFFNIYLLIISIVSIMMLHLQILNEEKHLEIVFGKEFIEYKNSTLRYFGKRK